MQLHGCHCCGGGRRCRRNEDVQAAKTEGHIRPVLLLAAHHEDQATLISANNTLARSITSQGGTHTLRRHFHRAKRIILIRHGESEGNVDESAYVNTADWQICLTDKGKRQAQNAGAKLKKHYLRTTLFSSTLALTRGPANSG